MLAIIFTGCQAFEYVNAPFSISDSVYGSTFYMATGFHGFHVFIGTCFLTVCLVRLVKTTLLRDITSVLKLLLSISTLLM